MACARKPEAPPDAELSAGAALQAEPGRGDLPAAAGSGHPLLSSCRRRAPTGTSLTLPPSPTAGRLPQAPVHPRGPCGRLPAEQPPAPTAPEGPPGEGLLPLTAVAGDQPTRVCGEKTRPNRTQNPYRRSPEFRSGVPCALCCQPQQQNVPSL